MANPAQAPALPQRLVNFFARYPPQLHSAAVRRPAPRPKEATVPQTPLPSPYTSDRDAKGAQALKPTEWTPAKALLVTSDTVRNPFLPHKRFGKWESPRYGLRQQADLMKLAIKYKVETLLPPSRKSPEFKDKRRQERGLQVKGTGIGQKVKGHKWERTMESRLEDRRKAMEGMPEMVRMWKQVGLDPTFSLTSLTRANREVMDVDGSNGPSGNGNAPTELVEASFYSLFWRVCSVLAFRRHTGSCPNCIPHQHRHLYEPHQELGMEFLFFSFFFRSILPTHYVQYKLRSHTPMLANGHSHIIFSPCFSEVQSKKVQALGSAIIESLAITPGGVDS